MSKTMLTAFALAGLMFGGAAQAAEGDAPPVAGGAITAAAKEVKPIGGTVVSCADGKLVLKVRNRETKEEKDQTFTTDAKTVVSIDGDDKKTVADLKAGVRVRVTATGDLATRVETRTKKMGEKSEKGGDKPAEKAAEKAEEKAAEPNEKSDK